MGDNTGILNPTWTGDNALDTTGQIDAVNMHIVKPNDSGTSVIDVKIVTQPGTKTNPSWDPLGNNTILKIGSLTIRGPIVPPNQQPKKSEAPASRPIQIGVASLGILQGSVFDIQDLIRVPVVSNVGTIYADDSDSGNPSEIEGDLMEYVSYTEPGSPEAASAGASGSLDANIGGLVLKQANVPAPGSPF